MSQPLAIDNEAGAPPRDTHVRSAQASEPRRFEAFGQTDVGQYRDVNEDSFAVLSRLGLFMVADGMGGHETGDVASKMAVNCVREAFEDDDTTWPWGVSGPPCRVPDDRLLVAGIKRANSLIHGAARRAGQSKGMGTTFAGILVLDDRVVIAHVGDSRVYRLRGHQLDLLTEDHSLLNQSIRNGTWDPAEADAFPAPNVITRAVGSDEDLEVDTRIDGLVPGDVYLICSDGLHGLVGARELASIMIEYTDVTQAVTRLIELANDYGGARQHHGHPGARLRADALRPVRGRAGAAPPTRRASGRADARSSFVL
jgi:serine/threonine protein phosphatase PrpC